MCAIYENHSKDKNVKEKVKCLFYETRIFHYKLKMFCVLSAVSLLAVK